MCINSITVTRPNLYDRDNVHRILFDKVVKVAPSLVVFIEAVEDEGGLDIEFLEAVADAVCFLLLRAWHTLTSLANSLIRVARTRAATIQMDSSMPSASGRK